MKYNFNEIAALRNKSFSRYADVGKEELSMSIADMDFKVLPEIIDVLNERINIGSFGYLDVPEDFYYAFMHWEKVRHNIELSREWLIFSTSVIASIDCIFSKFSKPGDGVIMFTPIYNTFYSCIRNHQLNLLSCPFVKKSFEYQIDFSLFEALLEEEDIKFLLLANPHNPGGKIFTIGEINKIVMLAKKHNVLIISDEIHSDIILSNTEYTSLINWFDEYENIIVLNSASKSFNLAGTQSSIAIVKDFALRRDLANELYKRDVGEPNCFGVFASIAAWQYGLKWNQELCAYLKENKEIIASYNLDKLGLHLIKGEATYLLWFKIPSRFKDGEAFQKRFYKQEGILISPGNIFGEEGKNYIRINIATSKKNIIRLCESLNRFLTKKTD